MQLKFPITAFRKSFWRLGQLLLLLGLGIVSAIAVGGILNPGVSAQEVPVERAAVEGNWRNASFPVENFQAYTSPFGYRQSPSGSSGWEFHRGLDIAAPQGSYIRNWWAGKVAEVSDNTNCGTSITIKSGEWQHIYCHMKGGVETSAEGKYLSDREGGILLWLGQEIPAGARIGRVGMTGRTTGPHLHWGLKYANNYVDPATVLRVMYEQQSTGDRASANTFGPLR